MWGSDHALLTRSLKSHHRGGNVSLLPFVISPKIIYFSVATLCHPWNWRVSGCNCLIGRMCEYIRSQYHHQCIAWTYVKVGLIRFLCCENIWVIPHIITKIHLAFISAKQTCLSLWWHWLKSRLPNKSIFWIQYLAKNKSTRSYLLPLAYFRLSGSLISLFSLLRISNPGASSQLDSRPLQKTVAWKLGVEVDMQAIKFGLACG